MTAGLKRRPSPGAEVAVERWELVPAEVGSGSWLVAHAPGSRRVWAPPGVGLTCDRLEHVERWRMLARGSAEALVLTTNEVLVSIPSEFHDWARECTAMQLRVLGLYISASATDDPHAPLARRARHVLQAELASVGQRRRPSFTPTPTPAPGPVADAFAALTDTEFTRVVRLLINKVFPASHEARHPNSDDAISTWADGLHHLIQIEHNPADDAHCFIHRARLSALALRSSPADVQWFITSREVGSQLRRQLLDAIGPWLADRYKVVDAHELSTWLRIYPGVEEKEPKLRAGRAISSRLTSWGPAGELALHELSRLAATAAFETARRTLRHSGRVMISGRPGTGKSALMTMLVADAAADHFRPAPATGAPIDGPDPRIIYWDDAEDLKLLHHLLHSVGDRDDVWLVITSTSQAILAAARDEPVTLDHYRLDDRARVYYNHVWNAQHLHPEARSALAEPSAYEVVLGNPQFTPRLAEHVAERGPAVLDELNSTGTLANASPDIEEMFKRLRRLSLQHGCSAL